MEGRIDFKCSHGLGEPQRPMLGAQAGRARPSPSASPPPHLPPVPSPGVSPATLQHPFGTVGHIRQERGSPSGRVFSLSLPPWLPPCPPWLGDSPAAAGAFLPLTRGRGPARVPQRPPGPPGDPRRVLYCASHPVSGPWLVLGERWRHSSPSLRAGWSVGLVPAGARPVVRGCPWSLGHTRRSTAVLRGGLDREAQWAVPEMASLALPPAPRLGPSPREQLRTCHARGPRGAGVWSALWT